MSPNNEWQKIMCEAVYNCEDKKIITTREADSLVSSVFEPIKLEVE